jgi:ketosteroid isomerase-like protein
LDVTIHLNTGNNMPDIFRGALPSAIAKSQSILLTLAILVAPTAMGKNFTAKDLAAEEGKFAAYSVKNGMRAAFIEFFAEKSWLLRPELVDAQAWLATRSDPAIILDWKSQRTILSASGDLGFSTGPSIVRDKRDPAAPASHGQFFSVWQKQKGGEWKVLVDHGIGQGPTSTPDKLSDAPLIAIDLPALKAAAGGAVDDPEQQFIARAANTGDAYAATITPRTRLLRADQLPIDGEKAIGEYLKANETQWAWSLKLQGASQANDFVYAVGNVAWRTREGDLKNGQYVRVWVRENDSETGKARWSLAGEVVTPQPPVKK